MTRPIRCKSVPALFASLALIVAPLAFASDALVQPVPVPDVSKLPQDKAKEVRDARVEFEKAKPLLVGDDLAQAHAQLGAAYARAGFYDAAAIALADASALAPSDARWIYAEGLVARMQKQNDAARGYFERALDIDKQYLPIRMAVVNERVEQGDLAGAHQLLSDYTATHTKDAVAFAMQGDIALRQKRYPEAVDMTKRALALDPQATKLYTQLADAYAGSGDAKAAADARAKAGQGVPGLGDPILLGLLQSTGTSETTASKAAAGQTQHNPEREAEVYVQLRQYDAARKTLDDALKSTPNDASLLASYARVEAAAGNFAQAKSRADAAVAANANLPAAQLAQGIVLEIMNDDRGAQRAYEKAVALDATSAEASINLGNLLMRAGRYDDAATRYRALTKANPSGEAWTRLMAADVAAGKCQAGMREINDALGKDSHNGVLMQLFVRMTSTCAAASAEEKRMALDYGRDLYRQNSMAPIGEAYALALGANGKFDDAAKTQEAAMFLLVRNGHRGEVVPYRDFLKKFQAHQMPDRPWPASSPLFQPARLEAHPAGKAPVPLKTPVQPANPIR